MRYCDENEAMKGKAKTFQIDRYSRVIMRANAENARVK